MDLAGPLIAAAAATSPALRARYVSQPELHWCRDLWLLSLVAVGGTWLAWRGDLWLAFIALWFLCRWRSPEQGGALIRWAAVGATWALLFHVPQSAWPWLTSAWVGLACLQSMAVAVQGWRATRPPLAGSWRQKGWGPSPAITAMSLALVAPFTPLWAWPVLGLGMALTCSWLAIGAVGVGMVWVYPSSLRWVASGAGLVALAWWASRRWPVSVGGRRLFEWLPRGDSPDSVPSRLIGWAGILVLAWQAPSRWWGRGPDSTELALVEVTSRTTDGHPPIGDACNELVQLTAEYGVLGLLAAGAFVWRVAPHLSLGDPWSAAWVIGAVLSLGHYPLRYPPTGLVWLAVSARIVTT